MDVIKTNDYLQASESLDMFHRYQYNHIVDLTMVDNILFSSNNNNKLYSQKIT